MPPVMIDIRSAEDSRDVVHRAVQALAEGKLVAFPTETVYTVAASVLNTDAMARLAALQQPSALIELAVKSADELIDYVPSVSPLAQRLARRCWPGPVTLKIDDSSPESLLAQLPPSVQHALAPEGALNIRVPAHQVFRDTLRLLTGPVAFTSVPLGGDCEAQSAQEVVDCLGDRVQLVLDDGRSRYGQPSSLVRVGAGDFEIVRPGVVSEQTLRRLSSQMFVFVCTGNTCRSPMAAGIMRKLVADKKGIKQSEVADHSILIESAGISAMMGSRPSPEAVTVVAKMDIDLRDHESQPLTEQLVQHADLIFAMTRSHRAAILSHWPTAADRVKLLCRDWTDVPDPIGGPPEQYQRCAQQIRLALESWLPELDI